MNTAIFIARKRQALTVVISSRHHTRLVQGPDNSRTCTPLLFHTVPIIHAEIRQSYQAFVVIAIAITSGNTRLGVESSITRVALGASSDDYINLTVRWLGSFVN
jgi:hypothetical protein